MQNLLVEHIDEYGVLRAWRLKPESDSTLTVGSSKHADIHLPDSDAGIEGAFEYKNGTWRFVNLNLKEEKSGRDSQIVFDKVTSVNFKNIKLNITPIDGKNPLFSQFDQTVLFNQEPGTIAHNLFLI